MKLPDTRDRERIAVHSGHMRPAFIRTSFVGATLMLAMSGCGSADSGTAEPTEAGSVSESSSNSAEPTLDAKEQITPAGIASIVLEHLGSDAVQQVRHLRAGTRLGLGGGSFA